MKLTVRRAADRGHFDHGWLNTWHSFSFASYYDPAHMGYRALRVINEDVVQPGEGFGTHPHRDMEILTYVLEGALEHRDSLGNGSVIRPGELQRMSAGTGILHSEFNHSRSERVHLLQIWLLPEQAGIRPGYEQKLFPAAERQGRLRLVASRDGQDGSLTIHQDARVYAGLLAAGDEVRHPLAAGRGVWVQLARGEVRLGDELLRAGDGASLSEAPEVVLRAEQDAELILFDLR